MRTSSRLKNRQADKREREDNDESENSGMQDIKDEYNSPDAKNMKLDSTAGTSKFNVSAATTSGVSCSTTVAYNGSSSSGIAIVGGTTVTTGFDSTGFGVSSTATKGLPCHSGNVSAGLSSVSIGVVSNAAIDLPCSSDSVNAGLSSTTAGSRGVAAGCTEARGFSGTGLVSCTDTRAHASSRRPKRAVHAPFSTHFPPMGSGDVGIATLVPKMQRQNPTMLHNKHDNDDDDDDEDMEIDVMHD